MSTSRDDLSGSENDEFPDLDTLVHRARRGKKTASTPQPSTNKPPPSVRRHKLVPLSDNTLLKPWAQASDSAIQHDIPPYTSTSDSTTRTKTPARPRVQTRTKKQEPIVNVRTVDIDEERGGDKASVEVASDDEASADDSSEFHDTISISDDSDDEPRSRYPIKSLSPSKNTVPRTIPPRRASPTKVELPVTGNKSGKPQQGKGKTSSRMGGAAVLPDDDLAGAIDRLCIDDLQPPQTAARGKKTQPSSGGRPTTPPPSTPPKVKPGLISPKKLPRIPTTPHHPNTDLFWSREFVDDWNDEHSPKKQLFPDAAKAKQSNPPAPLGSPRKKKPAMTTASDREAKKRFQASRSSLAQSFLLELDTTITAGRLSELASTTGGIKIAWSNKLNTTAGRANWKRETIRTRNPEDGSELSVKHQHHASIELAEKVIDDEHRLLNVVAHEFCHLANFMISGITNNPHGKEFKAWAALCSKQFGDRGIEVTTKHSYDIDFKYAWECTACALEYKRHSKSINPERHRCGACKSLLRQTRPTPRAGGGTAKKPSEYQVFMKEQMRLMKEENPGSPQKEIMKRVADRWSSLQKAAGGKGTTDKGVVEGLVAEVEILDLTGE
ncbi:SprT-like family-domain-containing protein [Coniochaeta sp. 2T2.1]|nr:SprT-like family-domain-containing protein [Coniochaeta sp. 2T2.1]